MPDPLVAIARRDPDPAVVEALRDLRQRRRRNAARTVDWVEALYRAYLAGILGVTAVLVLSGIVGDDDVAARDAARVAEHGPAWIGLGIAAGLVVAIRSGSRGGPLALEAPEVRHVLLAPVRRAVALRRPAIQQVRLVGGAVAAVGLVVGQLAVRRLPGGVVGWLAWDGLLGLVVGASWVGTAAVVSGRRVRRAAASGVSVVLVAWSVLDLVAGVDTSPLTLAGGVAVWPLGVDLVDLVGLAVLAVPLPLGLAALGGTSIEAAERRAGLVTQLRFAATLQDVRTVVLLRRQLAQEAPRARPWLRLRSRPGSRLWVARRGWHGILRWPAVRVARLVVCGAVAAWALVGVWSGTTPLVVVAGLALWVAALDAVEPLAQEADHPGRFDSYPVEPGQVRVEHLVVPVVVMVLVAAAGLAAALPADPALVAEVGAAALPAAVVAAVAAASIAAVRPLPVASDADLVLPPEVAGLRHVVRTVLPPAVAVVGVLPVALAASDDSGEPVWQAVASGGFGAWAVALATVAWLRYREPARAWWRRTQETAEAERRLQAERRAARRTTGGDGA